MNKKSFLIQKQIIGVFSVIANSTRTPEMLETVLNSIADTRIFTTDKDKLVQCVFSNAGGTLNLKIEKICWKKFYSDLSKILSGQCNFQEKERFLEKNMFVDRDLFQSACDMTLEHPNDPSTILECIAISYGLSLETVQAMARENILSLEMSPTEQLYAKKMDFVKKNIIKDQDKLENTLAKPWTSPVEIDYRYVWLSLPDTNPLQANFRKLIMAAQAKNIFIDIQRPTGSSSSMAENYNSIFPYDWTVSISYNLIVTNTHYYIEPHWTPAPAIPANCPSIESDNISVGDLKSIIVDVLDISDLKLQSIIITEGKVCIVLNTKHFRLSSYNLWGPRYNYNENYYIWAGMPHESIYHSTANYESPDSVARVNSNPKNKFDLTITIPRIEVKTEQQSINNKLTEVDRVIYKFKIHDQKDFSSLKKDLLEEFRKYIIEFNNAIKTDLIECSEPSTGSTASFGQRFEIAPYTEGYTKYCQRTQKIVQKHIKTSGCRVQELDRKKFVLNLPEAEQITDNNEEVPMEITSPLIPNFNAIHNQEPSEPRNNSPQESKENYNIYNKRPRYY